MKKRTKLIIFFIGYIYFLLVLFRVFPIPFLPEYINNHAYSEQSDLYGHLFSIKTKSEFYKKLSRLDLLYPDFTLMKDYKVNLYVYSEDAYEEDIIGYKIKIEKKKDKNCNLVIESKPLEKTYEYKEVVILDYSNPNVDIYTCDYMIDNQVYHFDISPEFDKNLIHEIVQSMLSAYNR